MLPGIDVSHFQRAVDWTAVAASEIRFCFIKATEGAANVDPRFIQNWRGAGAAGLLRGAYHFFHPTVPAATQAESFIRTVVRLEPGDLPPVLDLEVPAAWTGIASDGRASLAIQWLETVESRLGAMGLSTPTVIYGRNFQTRSSGNQNWTVVPFALGEDRMCVQVCIAPNDDSGKKTTRTGFPVPHLLRT